MIYAVGIFLGLTICLLWCLLIRAYWLLNETKISLDFYKAQTERLFSEIRERGKTIFQLQKQIKPDSGPVIFEGTEEGTKSKMYGKPPTGDQ